MLENFHENISDENDNWKEPNYLSESEIVDKCLLLLLGIPS